MNNTKAFLMIVLIIAFLFMFNACSKGTSNPIISDLANETLENSNQDIQLPASDDSGGIGLLGAYSLDISPDYSSAELVPVRGPSLGDSFIVSGVAYFRTQPCRDCLRISSIGLDVDENIVLGFTVSHPFDKGDAGQSPSGRNRLDLDIFDVELLVSSVDAPAISFPMMNADIPAGLILNPDGYSNDLGMILPFKNCYESSNNNRFEMGTKNQEFEVSFPKLGLLSYELYLTFGYGESATIETRFDPIYYVPEFNRKSAWKVEVDDTVWNDDDPSDVVIQVYDWNHSATVADEYPNPTNTNEISAASDVVYVFVEVPGMTNYLSGAASTNDITNGWDDPLIYTATFKNDNRLAVGAYTGLVCVIDSRSEVAGGPGGILIQTEEGKILNLSELPNYASYQTFKATIESISTDCGPISGEIISPECPVMGLEDGSTIDFVVSASSDNGGIPVTEYEIDIDFDGIAFDVDATSPDGSFPGVGPFENPVRNGAVTNYTVAFRATDSCVPNNKQIFETCQVTVGRNFNPVDVTPPWLKYSPIDVHVQGNYAYTAGRQNGLHIFDISNPLNPVWVNWVEMPEYTDANGVHASGDFAYLSIIFTGLVIVDINPPESAHIVKIIDTLEEAAYVDVSGGYAYVVDYNHDSGPDSESNYGFQIIDIDPPESAYIVKTVYTPGAASRVDVTGGYAYVADGAYGLQIFDIQPPGAAHIVKTVDLDQAYNVQVSSGYAYVAIYDYDSETHLGLQIIDIDPLESAHIVNSVDIPDSAWRFYISGTSTSIT